MPEVLVANDDLVVLGGPTSINVNVDLGATGKRGSQILLVLEIQQTLLQ